jgi:hypothetical protein
MLEREKPAARDSTTAECTREWSAKSTRGSRRLPLEEVQLTLAFKRENDKWVGWCLELGPTTHGNSQVDVRQKLLGLVELHLNSLEKAQKINLTFDTRLQLPPKIGADEAETTESVVFHAWPLGN